MKLTFKQLNEVVVQCTKCPRLVLHRETVLPEKKENEWRKPVPGYGDLDAYLCILGLAPSSQGANRTGRVFTGDLTAKFLVKALYKEGFANHPDSISKNDGLQYRGCYLTAAVKCVPPHHKPLKSEFQNCFPYFENEFFLLKKVTAVLALGKDAFECYVNFLKKHASLEKPFPKFSHGSKHLFSGWPTLYGSYHPTPQNTNTGRLTEEMFLTLLREIKKDHACSSC